MKAIIKIIPMIVSLFVFGFAFVACQTQTKSEVVVEGASASKTPDRQIASMGGGKPIQEYKYYPMKVVSRSYKVEDSQWGTFTVELVDLGEPVFAPVEMRVSLECKHQKSIRKKAKIVVLTKPGFKVCEYEGHRYDAQTNVFSIDYSLQSKKFNPHQEVCNEAYTEDFDIKKFCFKGTNR
ncbi:MAG: hypothetical protein KDD33_13250 [Bdellovibrionales bacterium]|nr:hypothetical protein [Bdellovibrionales bacterium]